MAMTTYVVLHSENGSGFKVIAVGVEAYSRTKAIKKIVQQLLDDGQMPGAAELFEAVALSAWNPEPITIDVQTTIKVG